jgi:hypothetical protein
MMNAALTRKKLEDFAYQVEDRDPDTAINLRDLGEAVTGGPTADAWAYSDLRAMLDPDRISNALGGDGSTDWITRGLEVLRNSLVLLPLAITWFGIALAVDGYFRLINAHPELAGQSFIYLWQGGFQGRTPLSLGTLAVLDAFLLTGVFALTLLAYMRSAWVSLMNRRFGAGFSQELSQALAEAELLLAPRRMPQYFASIHKLEQNAETLVNEIAEERQRLAELAQRREREFGDLNGATDNLKNTAVVFLNAAQSLASIHTATLAGLNGVTGAAKGLTASQQGVINAVHNVAGRIDGLLIQQQKTAEQTNAQITKLLEGTGTRLDGLLAVQQSGMVRLIVEQQRALQETAMKIDSLLQAQKVSIERVFDEQLMAGRGMGGMGEMAGGIDGLIDRPIDGIDPLKEKT